jgi:membrane peptidoglycan carboxypeptidase
MIALAHRLLMLPASAVRTLAGPLYGLATAPVRLLLAISGTLSGQPTHVFRGGARAAYSGLHSVAAPMPRLLAISGLGVKLALIATPMAIAGFIVVCALANPFVRGTLDYAHDRSSAAQIFDADGHWLGIMAPASFSDWSDGSQLPPDHAAAIPLEIPRTWRRCISFLEDRTAFDDGISNWLGFDPLAIAKSGVQTIFFQHRRGASTLLMQVVRTLDGASPTPHDAIGAVALRKVAELVGATTLARMLHDRDPEAVARYIGMHLPLIIGATGSGFGDEIDGIELASHILFGRPAAQLQPEEQAVLAAAVKTPVVLAPPDDKKGEKLAQARWARVKERAAYCLDHGFSQGSPEIAAARQRLEALALPSPHVDAALRAQMPSDPRQAWLIKVNPVRRATYFAGATTLTVAREELTDSLGADWRGQVAGVQLTVSALANRPLSVTISRDLDSLQKTVPGLGLSLTGAAASDTVQVVAAIADDTGQVRGLYASNPQLFLNGKNEIGSTAKMIAAIVLSQRSSPETLYCSAPIPGMTVARSVDDTACRDASRWTPARDAFAHSLSPAVNWALRHYSDPSAMKQGAAVLGLPALGDVPPATALSLGIVELTPAEMMRMAGGVGDILTGEFRDVSLPTVIAHVTLLGSDGVARNRPITVGTVLSGEAIRTLAPANARSFLKEVLSATSDPGGTLAELNPLKVLLAGGLYAKTGTVSVAGNTQALQIAGVFIRAGKPWTFTVLVAAPNWQRPLGRKLAAGDFAPLVTSLVSQAIETSARDTFNLGTATGDTND